MYLFVFVLAGSSFNKHETVAGQGRCRALWEHDVVLGSILASLLYWCLKNAVPAFFQWIDLMRHRPQRHVVHVVAMLKWYKTLETVIECSFIQSALWVHFVSIVNGWAPKSLLFINRLSVQFSLWGPTSHLIIPEIWLTRLSNEWNLVYLFYIFLRVFGSELLMSVQKTQQIRAHREHQKDDVTAFFFWLSFKLCFYLLL